MPRQATITEIRLKDISTCVAIAANTLDVLVNTLNISALKAISNTTQSLLKMMETIKQDKSDCAELMEHIHQLLNAIIGVYIKSDTGAELSPSVLNQMAKFTETLHKIYAFVEAQQSGSKVKKFFRQAELHTLLKDCKAGLQQGLDFFQIGTTTDVLVNVKEMQDQAQVKYQEVLNLVETMSSSDSTSSISKMYSGSYTSSNSISMLPAEPNIFHGRDLELTEILNLFNQDNPRVAILGAGGMGKTSLARTALHHEQITTKYQQNRFFITCDTVSDNVELAGLIGAHLELKPGKDLTQSVLNHFMHAPPSLLILDNLETPWEPIKSRKEMEEFLSLLADIPSLALLVTMRGAERPAKVQWTRPFLLPLGPLPQEAARKMFIDIADDKHSMEEVDQVLDLTDNMPLAIGLLAHLVDMEDCSTILSRWETEKTSLISEGHDRRSNLELSISLSLSSPRITSMPFSQDLLALLSMLPDGLSDVELRQSKFPIKDVFGCKTALLRTALAYTDGNTRLKVLVPVREYMGKYSPPTDLMIRPLLAHFHELLESYVTAWGKESGAFPIARITSNYTNIQNILRCGLQLEHPDIAKSIYCTCDFNSFTRRFGHATVLMEDISHLLPFLHDQRLKTHFIVELFISFGFHSISHPEMLIAQALDYLKCLSDPELECFMAL
ncbi:P-loop containing nucleoside triphosphate hydrolase protein [Mycena metata]|uniref:P-loop containing nucleoside triphosphate hydrolase protein n=1 Tax=Mycena metata TaxID=1033252 RepID=A0AAD7JZT3_9AGAR|nr:P-loop containing nucleoside triphosphate hydrolase protein [Mycena metata]